MKKLIGVFLVGALALSLTAASCGGSVKDSAGKAIAAAEVAYHVAAEAELALRCGEPTALPAPNCIDAAKHATFKKILLEVYNPGPPASGYLRGAGDLYALLPATGSPSTSEIFGLIAKVGEIIQRVVAGLPASTQAIAAAADSNVVKTVAAAKGAK